MKRNITKSYFLPAALLTIAIVPGLAGCGGGSTNGDSIAHTQTADPAVYEYQDNIPGGVGLPTAPSGLGSGLGTGSLTQPSAGDVLYATFGSPVGTTVGGILAGAGGTIATGLPNPGVYPAVTPTTTSLLFRSTVVNGQTANRDVPAITSVTIKEPNGTVLPETFAYNANANPAPTGPFVASEYVTPITIASPVTTGVFPLTASVTDASGSSSTTTFEVLALSTGLSALATTATSAPVITSGGATVTPSYVYGPDANGTYLAVVPPGTYTVGASAVTTTAGNLTVF